jgi:DNA-binding transcriptional LysR family regulator
VLAVGADDPLAHRRRVRLPELADREFVEYRADSALRIKIDEVCAAQGLSRREACEVDAITDLVELVSHGIGVALAPPGAIGLAAGGTVVGVPVQPPIVRELLLVTPRDRPLSPAAAALTALLGEPVAGRA